MGFGPDHCAASQPGAESNTHHNMPKQKKKEKESFTLGILNLFLKPFKPFHYFFASGIFASRTCYLFLIPPTPVARIRRWSSRQRGEAMTRPRRISRLDEKILVAEILLL
jgi:hypothetical protein